MSHSFLTLQVGPSSANARAASGSPPTYSKSAANLTDAIGHGKAPIQALVSYCTYACITGRSPVGLNVKDAGISDELRDLLRNIAWDTVSAYPMSGIAAKK